MARTTIQYRRNENVPVIGAILEYKGISLTSAPLPLIVDTGAGHTVITPKLEARLRLEEQQIGWDDEFQHQALIVQTLLGLARFKRLKKSATLWFKDDSGDLMWPVKLDFLLFSEQHLLRGTRFSVRPGEGLNFGLLGQDVLRQCNLFLSGESGYLEER